MPMIEVSDGVFDALKEHAEPLVDRPDDVIQRLLQFQKQHGRTVTAGPPNPPPIERGTKTPTSAFYEPILRVLREAGGELPTRVAVDRVGELMHDAWNEIDRAQLRTGEIRWRNTVRFARHDLVKQGKLDDTSPNGIWRLSAQVDRPRFFPWEDVDASRHDPDLQRGRSAEGMKARGMMSGTVCPSCSAPADQLAWFYFESPDETWRNLCGRAGWMAVCDDCHEQVEFSLDIMS